MTIAVQLPASLRKFSGDRAVVDVDGTSVRAALANLEAVCPGIAERILDGGELRRFVNVYIDDEDIRFLQGLETALDNAEKVTIIPAVAGGAVETRDPDSLTFGDRQPLRVGLLGCGTVGTPVAQALLEDRASLERAAGVRLELTRVAVRNTNRARAVTLPRAIVTTDALAVAIDPEIDIVVEVMGGTDPALGCILGALADNKSVVTANKELLAGVGVTLLDAPDADLAYEASVCGAIPIVRTFREYCLADRIESFTGIFSGTCNFVLSQMARANCSFDQALDKARRLGYAEADASTDVSGLDAAAKVAILARVAFGIALGIEDVDRKGIAAIDRSRVGEAASEGYVYKLLGGARRVGSGVDAWVRPVLVPRHDPLALIDGVENAVLIETGRAGRLTLQGPGAGGDATATAVLGDLVAAARWRTRIEIGVPCAT